MPNQIRRIMTAAKTKRDWDMSYLKSYVILHPIADTFFYLSSVLNPFLYNLSSQQFRQVFVQVLRCRLTIEAHTWKSEKSVSSCNKSISARNPFCVQNVNLWLQQNELLLGSSLGTREA
uniref:G-protein coupled receptors family 1 profile domain-containing protein n=1 Tax=Scleropages formosus TaxID=113540 RepID=A0A8C9VDN0_SCLFO